MLIPRVLAWTHGDRGLKCGQLCPSCPLWPSCSGRGRTPGRRGLGCGGGGREAGLPGGNEVWSVALEGGRDSTAVAEEGGQTPRGACEQGRDLSPSAMFQGQLSFSAPTSSPGRGWPHQEPKFSPSFCDSRPFALKS